MVVAGRIVSGIGGAGMDSLVNILITGEAHIAYSGTVLTL